MTTEGSTEPKGGNAIRRLVIAGVIIALAVWFILANTEEVGVKLWLVRVETPMWIMIAIVFVAGWAVGALLRRRSAKKRLNRDAGRAM